MQIPLSTGGAAPTTTNKAGDLAVSTVAEIADSSIASLRKQVLPVTDTLDMTNTADLFIIPNSIDYSSIEIRLTGGTGNVSVQEDISSDQSGAYSNKIGFRSVTGTDNHTATVNDLVVNNTYQRTKLHASAFKVYVSVAGTGTMTVTMLLKEE